MGVAIVKSNYTKQRGAAKAFIRYIENRPGKEGDKLVRTLFDRDGRMSRQQAYELIDGAQAGSSFFRFVISPEPTQEDTQQDLLLREITAYTIGIVDARLGKSVSYVGAIHADHTPKRHVHVDANVGRK